VFAAVCRRQRNKGAQHKRGAREQRQQQQQAAIRARREPAERGEPTVAKERDSNGGRSHGCSRMEQDLLDLPRCARSSTFAATWYVRYMLGAIAARTAAAGRAA